MKSPPKVLIPLDMHIFIGTFTLETESVSQKIEEM